MRSSRRSFSRKKGADEMDLIVKNETEKRYVRELKRFLNSGKTLEEFIKEDIKDKKQLSKLKCGLKLINDNDFTEKREFIKKIDNLFKKKPKYYKNKEEQFKVRNKENAINRMKNKRIKLAFRLEEISGLRVSEISKLTFDNISLDKEDNKLIINVIDGKYGKNRTVKCLYDKWVFDTLLDLGERKNGKLFYCEKYLMDNARKLGFHTHDLRKTFANIKYYNNLSNNSIEEIQKDLGHNLNSKTYLKYLNRDVNLYNTRWDNMKPFEERKIENE
jgi:integrase